MPIGLTAAGELVFPMSCEPVLAKIRGPAGTENPQAKPTGVNPPEKPETFVASPPIIEIKPAHNSRVVSGPVVEEKKVGPAASYRKRLSGKQRRSRPSSVETTGSINR
jgi:hypothetical protein